MYWLPWQPNLNSYIRLVFDNRRSIFHYSLEIKIKNGRYFLPHEQRTTS